MTNPPDAGIIPLQERLSDIVPYQISGTVRRCEGLLAVCEGIDDLLGLGEACWIEPKQYNSDECDPAER
jgi:hypothetical protein